MRRLVFFLLILSAVGRPPTALRGSMAYRGADGQIYDDNGNPLPNTAQGMGLLTSGAAALMGGQPQAEADTMAPLAPNPYGGAGGQATAAAPYGSVPPAGNATGFRTTMGPAKLPPDATTGATAAPPAAVADPAAGGGILAPYGVAPPAFPNIPAFTPPPAYVAGQFKAPSLEEALNDPGYQFRTQQGEDALQRWSAARGTLNDSGTAKALIDYGQNAGEQGYGNVYARDFGTFQANEANRANAYKTNYGTQYVDPYSINRQTQYIDPWTAAYNTWKQQGDFYLNNQGTAANAALGFGQLVNTL